MFYSHYSDGFQNMHHYCCRITDNLSCGEFSHTSKGLYAFSSDSYKPQKVIVKSAVNDQTIIMKEGLLIWQLMHPNVVKLLGAATIGRPVQLLTVIIHST